MDKLKSFKIDIYMSFNQNFNHNKHFHKFQVNGHSMIAMLFKVFSILSSRSYKKEKIKNIVIDLQGKEVLKPQIQKCETQ